MTKVSIGEWKARRWSAAAANEARRIAMLEQELVTDTFDDTANAVATDRLLAEMQKHHAAGDPHAA